MERIEQRDQKQHGRSWLIAAFLDLRPTLRLFLRNRLRSDGAVEDLLQDAFLRLSELADDFDCRQPRGYMFSLVRNLAVDHMRTEAVRRGKALSERTVALVEANDPSPELAAIASDWYSRFQHVLNVMPGKQRDVFILHKIRHLSYREIAARLDISPKRVEKRMSSALSFCRLHLRAVLDDMNIGARP